MKITHSSSNIILTFWQKIGNFFPMDDDQDFNPQYEQFSGQKSVKAPALIDLLVKGGVPINDIYAMTTAEFQQCVLAFGEDHGHTFEEIKKNLTSIKEEEEEMAFIQKQVQEKKEIIQKQEQKAQTRSSQEAIIVPDNESTQIAATGEAAPSAPIRYIQKHVKNDSDIYKERGYRNIYELNSFRSRLVSSLALPEASYYKTTLETLYKTTVPELNSGFFVAVNFPDGKRVSKYFQKTADISSIYIWCARQDFMYKEAVKLGRFVLIDFDGNEMDPQKPISSIPTKENRVLLFLRIIV